MKNQNSDRTQRSDQMIQKRFHRRWKRVVSLLSGIVVFCTTYALVLPAITLESPVYCGKEEHIHSDICYQESSQSDSEGNPLKILTCILEEHEHSRQCESNPASVETAEDWKNFLRDEYLKEMEEPFEESDSSPEIASSELPQNTEKSAETSSDPSEGNEPVEPDDVSERINQLSLNEKVLLVARSQLNAEARKDNFQVMEDGTEKRWNRYASISSDPYDDAGTWFVPWILQLLEKNVVWQPDQAAWIGQLEELVIPAADAKAGDIVILENDSEIQSGILSEVKSEQAKAIAWTGEMIEETETELNDTVLILKPGSVENLTEVQVEEPEDEEPAADSDSDETERNERKNLSEDSNTASKEDPKDSEKPSEKMGQSGEAKVKEADAQPLADGSITVSFDNDLPGTQLETGIEKVQIYETFTTPSSQTVTKGNSIMLPYPTDMEFRVETEAHPLAYHFAGWEIGSGNNTKLFQPGDSVSYSVIDQYDTKPYWYSTYSATFKAKWEGGKEYYSASFYIIANINAADLDYSEYDPSIQLEDEANKATWVNNLYTTYVRDLGDNKLTTPVNSTHAREETSYSSVYIAYQSKPSINYPNNGANDKNQDEDAPNTFVTEEDTRTKIGADQKIRSLVDPDGITKTFIPTRAKRQWWGAYKWSDAQGNRKEYTLGLTSFPSDELILRQLRVYQSNHINLDTAIRDANHQKIPVDDLTAENYTVQWRVFKINHNDKYWHIDGTLAAKNGYLQVTKQFYGDADAIKDQKKEFSISVNDSNGALAKTLVLTAGTNENLAETSDGATVHPVEISADGNTYTWRFPAAAFSKYKLYENGYSYSAEGFVSVAQYSVTNSKSSSQTSSGRQYYKGEGVEVTVEAYSEGDDPSSYQTVNFYNSYFNTNTFMLQKVDELGASIPGVSFKLQQDGKPVTVYQDTETGWWYPEQTTGSNYTVHSDGLITTDDQGNAFIVNFKDEQYAGTYTLTEIQPYGYAAIQDLVLTISNDGQVTLNKHDQAAFNDDGSILLVKNKAESIKVTAKKEWASSITSSNQKDVYVQLLRNGTPVGNPELLNSSNSWKKIWNDLPGKVGGEDAVYTVRETRIGDTYYDPGIPYDGFADYEVSYSNPVRDGNGNITLTVTNALYKGGFTVRKTDENGIGLQNAVFEVYSDPNCTTLVQQSTSGANGNLSFTALAAGDYYLKEISAPKGYQISENIYLVKISGSGELFELKLIKDDNTQETVTSLVNQQKTLQLKVQKEGTTVKALPGAVFKLEKFKPSRNEYETIEGFGQIVSKEDGSVQVPPMTVGKYRLTELKAPDGYMLIPGSYEFEVTLEDSGDLKIKQITEDLMSKGYKLDISNLTLTVTNDSGERLPDTGGTGTELYTFSGLAAIGVCLMYAISKRYSERRES